VPSSISGAGGVVTPKPSSLGAELEPKSQPLAHSKVRLESQLTRWDREAGEEEIVMVEELKVYPPGIGPSCRFWIHLSTFRSIAVGVFAAFRALRPPGLSRLASGLRRHRRHG
jgi:hypothetical protein